MASNAAAAERPAGRVFAGRDTDATVSVAAGQFGSLRWLPHGKQLVAVCGYDKHIDCRRVRTTQAAPRPTTAARKGQGRPVGHLVAWLRRQTSFETQQGHRHYFSATRQQRRDARQVFYNMPGGREFADAYERPRREDEESDEPDDIR